MHTRFVSLLEDEIDGKLAATVINGASWQFSTDLFDMPWDMVGGEENRRNPMCWIKSQVTRLETADWLYYSVVVQFLHPLGCLCAGKGDWGIPLR